MTKTVAKKDLYRHLKDVGDDVMKNGVTYTVLQNSKPAFYIVPLGSYNQKKYGKEDVLKFVFSSKNKTERNLATTYKKYLYQ